MILDVKVEEANFVLVSFYNPNTETEQVAALLDLVTLLETIKNVYDNNIILAGRFSFFFDTSLDLFGSKKNTEKKIFCQIY